MQSHGVTSDLIQESRALFVFHYGSVWYEHIQLVFLSVWEFSSHSRIVYSYGEVTIAGEELQILTYEPLSSEGSLACPIYCDRGHSFIMIISEDP